MFNDLDDAFGALRDRAPRPRFAPATAVRQQGRRRQHRLIAVAGIAAVGAVVGSVAGAGALVTGPPAGGRGEPAAGGSTPATAPASDRGPVVKGGNPTASPPGPGLPAIRAEFPDRLFLTLEDLPGMGYRRDAVTQHPMWPTTLMCEGFAADWYSSLPLAGFGRQYGFAKEAPSEANMGSGGPYAIQTVRRYRDDGARKMIANIDAFQACRIGRGGSDRELARDFGGDESRLWVVPPFDPISDLTHHFVYVRVGDVATEVDIYGLLDDTQARDLAIRVAERLANP